MKFNFIPSSILNKPDRPIGRPSDRPTDRSIDMNQIPVAHASLAEDAGWDLPVESPASSDTSTLWDYFVQNVDARAAAPQASRRWATWMSPAASLGLDPDDRTTNPTARTLVLPLAAHARRARTPSRPRPRPRPRPAFGPALTSWSTPDWYRTYGGLRPDTLDLVQTDDATGQGQLAWTDSMVRQHILPVRLPVDGARAFRVYAQMLDGTPVEVRHTADGRPPVLTVLPDGGTASSHRWRIVHVVSTDDGAVWILDAS